MPDGAQYVVFGEALTDFIRESPAMWRAVPGGSCWNVARVGARLGVPTGFAGAVSCDTFGDELLRLSDEAGLDRRFLQRIDKSPLLAMVVSRDPPTYFFVGDDSADLNFDPAGLPRDWLRQTRVVHFGSIALARQPLAGRLVELAGEVHAAGKRIAFDPNYRILMGDSYQPTLRRMAQLADFIKVSDEDLRGLFRGMGESDAIAQLRAWAPNAQILLTRGSAGMTLLAPQATFTQQALRVDVVDTVGAGDASMAGWMVSQLLAPDAPAQRHLGFAAATAAAACRRAGAYAPDRAEVEALMSSC